MDGRVDGWMDVRNLSKRDQVSTTYIPHRTPKSKLKQIPHKKVAEFTKPECVA